MAPSAQEKANRGFQIGNLVVNLVSQQTQLSTTFQANCKRIEAFLELNERYSARALKRIKMVADEIKTADEVADEAADTEDGADTDAASCAAARLCGPSKRAGDRMRALRFVPD